MEGSFIVENAVNTCYIDSILMGLFYQNSNIDKLLEKELRSKNGTIIYLQEYIKQKFVLPVRQNKSVLKDDIEMIKTLSFQLGWKNQDYEEYIKQQDANEYYCFLMDLFENSQIEISNSNINIGKSIPFIPLYLPENIDKINVNTMLQNWLQDKNTLLQPITEAEGVKYNITNVPMIFPLLINRFNNKGTRIQTEVIIQKKINPFIKKTVVNMYEWILHSAICHTGDTLSSGHYYTLLSFNNNNNNSSSSNSKWYLFDDMKIPSMREVKMDDKSVTDMIKKDCVFLIYRLL